MMKVTKSKTGKKTKVVKSKTNRAIAQEDKSEEKKVEEAFSIRIINTLNYNQRRLAITKHFTIQQIQEAYAPFENHPEYYLWQDMYGHTLDLDKTVVQNKLVGEDEVVEFDGILKEPAILLVFKDGFENMRPPTLNPTLRNEDLGLVGLCRNY